LRLADIVEELESRLKTVRSQAGRAQKHSEVSKRLELLRTHVGLEDWRKLTARIDALRNSAGVDEADVTGMERELAECDARVAEVDRENDELQRGYRELATAESAVRERLAQCESTRGSNLARIDELELETQRLGQQLLILTTRAGDSQQLVAETTAELAASQQQFDSGASVIEIGRASCR